jgi:hypothetical protein
MGFEAKAGVNDKVTFQLKRAPEKVAKTKSLKKKIAKVFSFFKTADSTDEDDEDDDDIGPPNTPKQDPFAGLFFMARK